MQDWGTPRSASPAPPKRGAPGADPFLPSVSQSIRHSSQAGDPMRDSSLFLYCRLLSKSPSTTRKGDNIPPALLNFTLGLFNKLRKHRAQQSEHIQSINQLILVHPHQSRLNPVWLSGTVSQISLPLCQQPKWIQTTLVNSAETKPGGRINPKMMTLIEP